METVELFGETLRYDAERSDHSRLIWRGLSIVLAAYRRPDDASTVWALRVDGSDLSHTIYHSPTVAEAARYLAEGLLDEIEDRAQVARRLLAGLNVELKGGER